VDEAVLDRVLRPSPLVTLLDAHPHTLAFLGTATGTPMTCLGVSEFGQAGTLTDVYRHHGLDAESVVAAALDLLDA
jgi:pyruvate dehydrogenase E1 component